MLPSPDSTIPAQASTPAPAPSWQAGGLRYDRRQLAVLFSWLLWGDFTLYVMARAVPPVFQLLLKKFAASDAIVGALVGSVPALVGLTIVPVVSYRSDRHRGARGRRLPYLLFFTPLAVASLLGLAATPRGVATLWPAAGLGGWDLNTATVFCLGIYYALFSVAIAVVAGSLFGALINDVVPRPLLGRFYGLFRAFGLIAAMIFYYWGFAHSEKNYPWILAGAALLYGVSFTLMCLKVKEGPGAPVPPSELEPGVGLEPATHALRKRGSTTVAGFVRAAKTYLREGFGRPYYLWVFLAINLTWLAFVPVNLFSLFYAQSVGLSLSAYGAILTLTSVISFLLSYLLGAWADRFHPLRLGAIILFAYAAAMAWGGAFARSGRTFAIAFVAHEVLSGAWMTATASLTPRLFPQAKFAQYVSAMGIFAATMNILVPPLIGQCLDWTGHVYRYTYLAGGAIAVLALAATGVLYRKFVACGGPAHYRAPD